MSARALRATTEKFEFVIEVHKSRFLSDFIFQLMGRTGGLNGLDASALGANQIVPVDAGEQEGEVSSSFVKSESANHSFFGESLKKAENRGLVTFLGKVAALGEFVESHRAVALPEAGQNGFETFRAPQAGRACRGNELFERRNVGVSRMSVGRHV